MSVKHNIILPSTPGSSYWPLSLRFPHQNPVYATPFPHAHYMFHPFIFYITMLILFLLTSPARRPAAPQGDDSVN